MHLYNEKIERLIDKVDPSYTGKFERLENWINFTIFVVFKISITAFKLRNPFFNNCLEDK